MNWLLYEYGLRHERVKLLISCDLSEILEATIPEFK